MVGTIRQVFTGHDSAVVDRTSCILTRVASMHSQATCLCFVSSHICNTKCTRKSTKIIMNKCETSESTGTHF